MFRLHLRLRISNIAAAVAVIVSASPLPAGGLDRTYTYNAADQLIEVKESGVTIAEHTYDGDGERVIKRSDGQEIIFVRDPAGQVLAEYDGTTGALIAEYVYLNGQRIARIAAGGSTTYFHNDHLGTPRAITDATGQVVWEGETLPFGNEYVSSGSRDDHYTFTGHEWDAGLDLHYMHARYYSPDLGRFITVDPVGGMPGNLQSWNRYAYALNNPVRLVDPNGENAWDVVDPAFFLISIGNLWRKAITGRHITPADNLQVAGDAVGMIPIVPALGTAGRVVREGVEHGPDVARAADELVDGVTGGKLISWNEFQKLYANQGIATSEKSAMYSVYRTTGVRPVAPSEMKAVVQVRSSKAEELAKAREIYEVQTAARLATNPADAAEVTARTGFFRRTWTRIKSWCSGN